MDFVDEKDDLTGAVHHFLHHALEALFKFTLILCARDKGAHIQGINGFTFQILRHLPVHNFLGDTLGDGGLAHAGLAHQDGVVLGAPAQDLKHAPNLIVPANHRVQFALRRPFVEVDCKFL